MALDEFAAKWDKSHQAISQIWRRNWLRIIPFFQFPAEIRKVIYTTNAIKSLNMSLRKIIKTRGSFPNEESAFRLLYLALRNHSRKWTTIQGWREALNRFQILWPDRMPPLERQ
jgi:putative transposase